MLCVLHDISKTFDSNSEMNITSLQSVQIHNFDLCNHFSEMPHGTLILEDL